MVAEARDAGSTTVCFFFQYFTNFFYRLTTILQTMTTVMTGMMVTTTMTGAWDATVSRALVSFLFFFLISSPVTNTYIFTVATTTPPSPLLPPLPLPQNSSRPRNDDEKGQNDGTSVPSFVPQVYFFSFIFSSTYDLIYLYIETTTYDHNRMTAITIPGLPRHVIQRRQQLLSNTTQWQYQLRRRSPSIHLAHKSFF